MKKDFRINLLRYHLMDNEYFKILKLKTGEQILCSMSNDVKSAASETHLRLTMPVQVVPQNETRKANQIVGESFFLRPWIGLSDSEEFVISTDIIVTIGDVKREVKEHYINYVEHAIETNKRIRDKQETSDAVDQLIRDVSNGQLNIVDEYLTEDRYEEDTDQK